MISAQMCEVPGEVAPVIDFEQQVGDLHVRQERAGFVLEDFGGMRD